MDYPWTMQAELSSYAMAFIFSFSFENSYGKTEQSAHSQVWYHITVLIHLASFDVNHG